MIKILACDTGMAMFGWALCSLREASDGAMVEVHFAGVVTTKPSAKKAHVYAVDDNLRRLGEIIKVVKPLMDQASVLCVESLSLPRNASSSAKMGMAMACVLTMAKLRGMPILQSSPQNVKRALVGKITASKDEMITRAKMIAPELSSWRAVPATKHGHIADAIGVMLACSDDDGLRAALAFSAVKR